MEQKQMNRRDQRRKEQMRRRRNRRLALLGIGALLVIIVIILLVKAISAIGNAVAEPEDAPVAAETQQNEKKGEILEVTFKATGDNLIHNTIYEQAAARSTDGGYDFSYCYNDIIPIIEGTDLVFVNQETPVATSVFEPSNYPLFNTPSESVTALKDAGFNLFNLASNHSLDKGTKGIEATLDFMDSVQGITHFGSYRNYTDEHTPRVVEKNGITFAFVGVTEMTNGMSLPSDTELDIVYTEQSEKIKAMLKEAKDAADVVVLSAHWGDENVLAADQRQKDMAADFAEWGADIIIGHHPHVLQEIESVTTSDGRSVPVVYSLGNFISAMRNKSNHIGGFYGCTFQKNTATGEVNITDQSFTPVVNYFTSGYQNMKVVPFSAYTNDMAASHGLGISMEDVNSVLKDTVGTDLLKDMPKSSSSLDDDEILPDAA
ncbi:MAG: CapA family protein [Bacillota bacterium]|nr:CapA family protein [Bacillota bacterium]